MPVITTILNTDDLQLDSSVSPNPEITRDTENRITSMKYFYKSAILTISVSWLSGTREVDGSPAETISSR